MTARREPVLTADEIAMAERLRAKLLRVCEHDWKDYGGSAYLCVRCDLWWHPSHGPCPPCVEGSTDAEAE